MAGNVEEWTSTKHPESRGAFRMKGGSFLVDDMNPDASNESIGERIASGETRYADCACGAVAPRPRRMQRLQLRLPQSQCLTDVNGRGQPVSWNLHLLPDPKR
jgi:hypothetical protein